MDKKPVIFNEYRGRESDFVARNQRWKSVSTLFTTKSWTFVSKPEESFQKRIENLCRRNNMSRMQRLCRTNCPAFNDPTIRAFEEFVTFGAAFWKLGLRRPWWPHRSSTITLTAIHCWLWRRYISLEWGRPSTSAGSTASDSWKYVFSLS